MNVPLAILIVFASAKILRELFERLKQPGIVGEILAGVLIGPHALGWIATGDVLTALSEIGVIFLLFRIGLEVKPSDLFGVGGQALAVASGGISLSFVMGAGIALLWGLASIQAMFMGAAVVSTSVVITAEVLSSRGLLHLKASRVILGAAVVDDVMGLIVLALVSSFASGRMNGMDLVLTAALASAFTIAVALWGHRAVRHVVPRMQAGMRTAEAQFTLAMVLLFSLAVLAVYAGVAAIIGAFLAGMALSETVEPRVHTMTGGVAELLVPFFLAGIGMRLDPAVFANAGTAALAGVLFAGALVSKLVGCGLSAYRLGWRDAVRVGAGMAPRGEVGMVVAELGRKLGVMPESVYAIVIFLSIATTLAAPPMIGMAFRRERNTL